MARIIAHLEDHPFLPTLDPRGPYLKYLNCMADHGPSFPKDLKKQVKDPKKWRKLATRLAGESRKLNSFLATTQAVDLIQGGVKVNALPEVVTGTSIPASRMRADFQLLSTTESPCKLRTDTGIYIVP